LPEVLLGLDRRASVLDANTPVSVERRNTVEDEPLDPRGELGIGHTQRARVRIRLETELGS
jgi:hypothetical protein